MCATGSFGRNGADPRSRRPSRARAHGGSSVPGARPAARPSDVAQVSTGRRDGLSFRQMWRRSSVTRDRARSQPREDHGEEPATLLDAVSRREVARHGAGRVDNCHVVFVEPSHNEIGGTGRRRMGPLREKRHAFRRAATHPPRPSSSSAAALTRSIVRRLASASCSGSGPTASSGSMNSVGGGDWP
jgi:hypothetical protein